MEKRIYLLNLFFACVFFFSLNTEAKEGKIKYGKNIIYEGIIENKIPQGQGVLRLLNPTSKGEVVMQIDGNFDNLSVNNAIISSNCLPKFTCLEQVVLNCIGEPEKCLGIELTIKKGKIELDNITSSTGEHIQTMVIDSLFIKYAQFDAKTRWIMSFDKAIMLDKQEVWGVYKTKKVPEELTNLKYETDDIMFAIEKFTIANSIQKITGISMPTYQTRDESIFFKNELLYKDGHKVSLTSEGWVGTRVLTDGTSVSCKDGKLSIKYANGTSYKGTVKETTLYPLYAHLDNLQIHYLTGVEITQSGTIHWINGETTKQLRERLQSTLREDWLNRVESGKMSETEAIAAQQEEDIKIKNAEEAAKILKQRWGGNQVLLQGNITGNKEGDEILRTMFSCDHTFFEGQGLLQLDDSGYVRFVIAVVPNMTTIASKSQSYNTARARSVQISEFAKRINEDISGTWSIEGNKILINGKSHSLTIGKDGKTVSYEGMLNCTMKVTKVSQESAVK